MSKEAGWAALHLEKPSVVPRTEYSADFHWPLIEAVTGHSGLEEGGPELRAGAVQDFVKAWDYAFIWSTLIGGDDFGAARTKMGHAEYMSGREDYSESISSAFATPEDVLAFRPLDRLPFESKADLVRRFNDHYKAGCRAHQDTVNMTGIYVTCVSGLIDLFGWDLLLEALADDMQAMASLTLEYGEWVVQRSLALAESEAPVVMIHDDLVWTSGPFVHPDWYRACVFPTYRKVVAPLVEAGKRVIFTADGNYTDFVDEIAACGVHGFVMEPATDMAMIAERYGRTHFFVGNADTRILLSGSEPEIEAEVARCMAIGRECPGFIMAVGNHIPPNTPVASALAYDRAYRDMRRR